MKLFENMTIEQKMLIYVILREVESCMQYDEDIKNFTDGGRFLLSLDKSEIEILNNLLDL